MLSRMKFEIEPLVAEMLDQLPDSVWSSQTSTFLDPAVGGGQFVRAIEQRLRERGHSDANIRSRVFGFEESELHIRFAVNKYSLVGQYAKMPYNKFFELDHSMKFDVIVGNPPYQGDQAHGLKIWPTFTVKALGLLSQNGYIGWVIPSGWLDSNNAQMKKVRLMLTTNFNLINIDRNSTNYFNVGQDILSLVANNTKYIGKTNYIDGNGVETIDLRNGLTKSSDELMVDQILNKVIHSEDERLELLDEHLPSSEVKESKTKEYPYPIIYSTANRGFTKVKMKNAGQLKLALNMSSSFYSDKTTDNNMPITDDAVGALMCYLPINSIDDGTKIKSYLSSKLIRFVAHFYRRKNTGFNHAVRQRKLPKLKIKNWTDQEIYKHFGLTQEEIDYVEANVK